MGTRKGEGKDRKGPEEEGERGMRGGTKWEGGQGAEEREGEISPSRSFLKVGAYDRQPFRMT